MIRLYAALALILALLAGGWYLHHSGYESGVADNTALVAKQDAAATIAAHQHELDQQARIATLAAQYEKDKADAQTTYDDNLAGLRSGQLRLRKQWTCPSLPEVAASPGQPDASAELRQQDAANLVRLAAEADAQIKGLQGVLMGERQ